MNKKKGPKASNSLKGFISGSLIIGGAINPFNIVIQILLIVVGILVLMDALLMYGKNVFPATTTIAAILGAVLAVIFTLIGYSSYFLSLMMFIFVVLYLYYLAAKKGVYLRMRNKKE